MRAIEITEFGSPDVLEIRDYQKPVPKENEVLIKVHAAGVNRPDLLQRQGLYPPPAGVTDIPGLEVAGEVVESKSSEWKTGDKVCALLAGGGYAEYVAVHGGQCLPVPEGFSMIDAASLPETLFTVWNNLFVRGSLKKGESVLIHGGSSGIGVAAIQMAKSYGANVYVTCGIDEKCRACIGLGAEKAMNYKNDDFVSVLGKESIDVVLDMVGGDYIPRNLDVLKLDGRHVSIAFLRGKTAEIDIRKIMHKRIVMTGSTLRPRSAEEKQDLRDGLLENIWPFLNSGKIKPVIHKIFDLENASSAHQELEKGDHIGKIILRIL